MGERPTGDDQVRAPRNRQEHVDCSLFIAGLAQNRLVENDGCVRTENDRLIVGRDCQCLRPGEPNDHPVRVLGFEHGLVDVGAVDIELEARRAQEQVPSG